MKLKPYPEYRDSGLPWLGDIPAHWGISSLRRLARVQLSNVDKHTVDGEVPVRLCNYTDVYYRNFISPDIEFMEASALPEEIEKFELRRGDVLITKDSESWTDIAVPAYVTTDMPGVLCGYHLAQIRPYSETLRGGYLFRAFQAEPIAYQFRVAANGVTRYGLSGGNIAAGLFPVPPEAEQDAITTFLDRADRIVYRLILAKQQLIELLNEQKQTIIHHAVTRGLDPVAPMKPTGLDWLPEVPEHWEVVRFKARVGFQEGPGIMAADFRDHGVPLLRISCLSGEEATLNGCNFLDPAMVSRKWRHFAVQPGDYLLSASTGAVSRATEVVAGAIPYTGILRLWARSSSINMEYIRYFIRSQAFIDQIDTAKSEVGIEHFGPTHLKQMWLCVPPKGEQEQIVRSIREQNFQLDRAIDRARREIALIREYRARLISDVVTGKLDVRGVELSESYTGEEGVKVSSDVLESVVAEG